MSSWRFIWKSLTHHWRINVAVALGVMAATAVLTGALLVGDSVRGSLLGLTLDRLGKIDELLISDHFFRAELAGELSQTNGFSDTFSAATPAIIFPSGTVEHQKNGKTNRSSGVMVVGCDDDFWKLGDDVTRPSKSPGVDEIILNEPLAEDLGISPVDWRQGNNIIHVTLRIPNDQAVAADFAVGKKEGLVSSLPQLKVVDIIPAESLGRFSMHASQTVPRNAYVSIGSLQKAIDKSGKVNALLVSGARDNSWRDESSSEKLAKLFKPTFEDYGFILKRATLTFQPADDQPADVIFDYFSFSSERMVLDDATANAAEHAFIANLGQPMFTYLANSVGKGEPPKSKQDDSGIPWSMITAVDFSPQFAPVSMTTGQPIDEPLEPGEIVLNSWAADDQKVKVGDEIYVKYFEPETSHGAEVERVARFKLKDIVQLTKPSRQFDRRGVRVFRDRPTLANDPDLTPFVPGVTDAESIEKWDLPFDTSNIQGDDDVYWKEHRTTPKAFVSLTAGRELWRSRFGEATTYRIPAAGTSEQELKDRFLAQAARDGATFGLEFIPIKRDGALASSGTTPFDGLFLGLSFFIVVAALLLVSLLFRLGVEQRANELGILLAVGLSRRLSTRLLVVEGAIVAALGGLFGVAIGIAYAWLMLTGLKTIWVGAIVTPFLQFHWTAKSLAIGYVSGVLISMLTIAWSVRQTKKVSIRQLLSGQAAETGALARRQSRIAKTIAVVLIVVAGILAVSATQLGGEAQAGAFVGGGMMLLSALLAFTWTYLRYGNRTREASQPGLMRLAVRNAGRNPARSTITIGLVAFASFLIAAMSCFRLAPTEEGTGGFDWIGQSSRPIFENLQEQTERKKLLDVDADVLGDDGVMLSLRMRPGDDASCNNLYQSAQPRVLGVPPTVLDYFDQPENQRFSFAAHEGIRDQSPGGKNPWRVLNNPHASGDDDAIPVVIDKNTAMYSLKLYFGIGQVFEREYDGRTIKFRVAGLLANSILQGSLIISEENFEKLFRQISGYRYFLLKSPSRGGERLVDALENRLSDQGFDALSSRQVLEQLLAVQNTYLSTFQSLGAIGLLLGTFGLATVQLRSVLERRQELALMRATGFAPRRLAGMVMIENAILLFGGLLTGIAAALLAVLPHMMYGSASVPFGELAIMLGIVVVVGFASGFAAVRATLKAPLLSALRGD